MLCHIFVVHCHTVDLSGDCCYCYIIKKYVNEEKKLMKKKMILIEMLAYEATNTYSS